MIDECPWQLREDEAYMKAVCYTNCHKILDCPYEKVSKDHDEFSTGAVRDTSAGKPRPDLISPFFLMRLGKWLYDNSEEGGGQYPVRNWEKGMPYQRVMASLIRHVLKYQMGSRDEDHLAAIGFNVMALCHYEEMVKRGLLPLELADMPTYNNKEF